MIDAEGFRANVGIILVNDAGHVFWGRRIGQNAWQFPQGGIKHHETPEQALFRELQEEVGLTCEDVELLGATQDWLRYLIPRRYLRRDRPPCIGQKQLWYLLRLTAGEERIRLDADGTPGVRRLALGRLLGTADADRQLQARGLPPGAGGTGVPDAGAAARAPAVTACLTHRQAPAGSPTAAHRHRGRGARVRSRPRRKPRVRAADAPCWCSLVAGARRRRRVAARLATPAGTTGRARLAPRPNWHDGWMHSTPGRPP